MHYENEILPFAKTQEQPKFIIGSECTNCCGKNYLSIKGLDDILEDGECVVCSSETKVFNSFIARQVIQKYGYRTSVYFEIKQKFIKDMEQR